MTLAPHTHLGPYEIIAKFGEGGMGEVYRATDSKLKRDVAIKVLPAAFTADKERLARFEREAQLLAQIHHPNIASIFGLEESGGVRALVMELVEGDDLSVLTARGPLPVDEALAIARQIAEALEAAHERGIVHRDLKPANVKVRADGTVKVLDFGLAKAMDAGADSASQADLAPSPTLMNSPTLTAVHGTQLGMVLGTAAYMAPEQAAGKSLDRRADIWAFGVVLWEMLSGRRLFNGETVPETLGAIFRQDVDFAALPASVPPAVHRLVERCLVRDPKLRLRDIGEARIVLASAPGSISEPQVLAVEPRSRFAASLPWTIAALLAVALIAVGGGIVRRAEKTLPAVRPLTAFGVLVPETLYIPRTQSPPLDVSADGRSLLFVAEGERSAGILRRSFDRLETWRVEGSDGAEQPILSPDGRSIAFFAGGKLMKIGAEGGTPIVVAQARAPRGASWAPDGSLIFSPVYNSGLWRVPSTGGVAVALTELDAGKHERTHRWPQVLPDGRTVIFTVGLATSTSDYDGATIDAVRLDTGERRTILEGARMARYTAAGYLVFQRRQTLLAVRFDPVRLEQTGKPFVIQEGVGGDTGGGAGYFAVSASGTLVYVPESAIQRQRVLVLADRNGKETELPIPPASFLFPRFSPSGDRLALVVGGGGLTDDDVFVYDLAAKRLQRLTFHQRGSFPVWSPDGRRLAFTLGKSVGQGLALKSADGNGEEVEIPSGTGFDLPDVWLADGRIVVSDVEQTFDIRIVDSKSGVTTPLFASQTAAEYAAAVSPDGHFIAYTSTENALDEVFVESFPPGAGKWQVSTAGGVCPVWSRDGRELFFVSGTTLMAVDVETRGAFHSGAPHPLFTGPYELNTLPRRSYDVGPDGRFVLVKRKLVSTVPREVVVLDGWQGTDSATSASQ